MPEADGNFPPAELGAEKPTSEDGADSSRQSSGSKRKQTVYMQPSRRRHRPKREPVIVSTIINLITSRTHRGLPHRVRPRTHSAHIPTPQYKKQLRDLMQGKIQSVGKGKQRRISGDGGKKPNAHDQPATKADLQSASNSTHDLLKNQNAMIRVLVDETKLSNIIASSQYATGRRFIDHEVLRGGKKKKIFVQGYLSPDIVGILTSSAIHSSGKIVSRALEPEMRIKQGPRLLDLGGLPGGGGSDSPFTSNDHEDDTHPKEDLRR